MPKICWYFQLHQPYRLNDFSLFSLGKGKTYFSDAEPGGNGAIFRKVAEKSYLPMLSVLVETLQKVPEFSFALSCSGVFLEQAEQYEPKVIELLQEAVRTGRVEVLAETYYHSLAALYSPSEFQIQIQLHTDKVQKLFGVTPQVFRNTELITSNEIAALVARLGFTAMLTEAVPRYLGDRPRTQVYQSFSTPSLPLLLKHAPLSDDIAFRFSDRNWPTYPLYSTTYLRWLEDFSQEEIIGLFMDFETFGEHQWADTGIFDFFRGIVADFVKTPFNCFITPSEAVKDLPKELPVYDIPEPISWADIDRDLTAWRDNPLQIDTLAKIYSLESAILERKDEQLLQDWRYLQTSDHFYYMCTKWAADGDVHAYFSPYDTPFEAYRRFSLVLSDIMERLLIEVPTLK